MAPGTYELGNDELVAVGLLIKGTRGNPPLIRGDGDEALSTYYTDVRDVDLVAVNVPGSTSTAAVTLRDGSTLDRSYVTADGSGMRSALRIVGDSIARNVVASIKRPNGEAVLMAGDSTLRNATAIAGGSNATGIEFNGEFGSSVGGETALVTNSIARGEGADIGTGGTCGCDTPDTFATISYSNYQSVNQTDPDVILGQSSGNQTQAPVFILAAAGNYHQKAASPTIDAGLGGLANGAYDIDGGPRSVGGGVDIGADEFVPPKPPPPPPPPTPDKAIDLSASLVKNRIRAGRPIKLRAGCKGEYCRTVSRATYKVPRKGKPGKLRLRTRKTWAPALAGRKAKILLQLKAKLKRKLKRLTRRKRARRRTRVVVKVKATDEAGNTEAIKLRGLRLKK